MYLYHQTLNGEIPVEYRVTNIRDIRLYVVLDGIVMNN